MAMIPGVTYGVPEEPKPNPESNAPDSVQPAPLETGQRMRPSQFWLEQSDTRDSWFGMRKAKPPRPHTHGRGAKLHGTAANKVRSRCS